MTQAETREIASAWIHSTFRGDPDFAELLQMFVDELPEKQVRLRDLAGTGDFDTLRREAHMLRGSAGGYGFPELSRLAGTLEDSCKIVPPNEAAILRTVEELLDHLGRVRM